MRARDPLFLLAVLLGPRSSAWADMEDGCHSSLCVIGDVNHDGVADFAVADRRVQATSGRGIVWVVSGKDGSALFALHELPSSHGFGRSLAAAGDLDRDGIDDVLVTESTSLYQHDVRAFSGGDGQFLRTFEGCIGPESVPLGLAGAADLNRDGVPDVVFGVARVTTGIVLVLSGKDGRRITTIARPSDEKELNAFGSSLLLVPDADGDGVRDLAIGSPGDLDWDPGNPQRGNVGLYSSVTGRRLARFEGEHEGECLGWALADAGDLDGDGRPDLLVSASSRRVVALSGGEWKRLFEVESRHGRSILDGYATSIASLGDVDGDGTPDWTAGADESSHGSFFDLGYAVVLSGRSARPIREVFESSTEAVDVAGPGDLDCDHVPDLLLCIQERRKPREAVEPDARGEQIVRALSGRDGRTLWSRDVLDFVKATTRPDAQAK